MTTDTLDQPTKAREETGPAVATDEASLRERLAALSAGGKLRQAPDLVDEAIERGVPLESLLVLVTEVVSALTTELKDVRAAERALARAARGFPDEPAFLRMHADLVERDGRPTEALTLLEKLVEKVPSDGEKGALYERMGDLVHGALAKPDEALARYGAAFQIDRERRSAIRKAAELHLAHGREEKAKQLVDLEAELYGHMSEKPDGLADELADLYARIADALLLRPPAHGAARVALENALRLAPEHGRAKELLEELEAFPQRWKEHVRRLRDAALDARDKREAARNYLAIAEIHRAYDPDDKKQMEQNVDKCLLLAPGYRPALKLLEQVHREEGTMDAFLERLRKQAKAIRTADVAVDIWHFLAALMREQGASSQDLAEAYEQVRRIDPRNVDAIGALTEIHLGNGHYDEAAQVMEDFLAQASDVEAKRQTLRQLARLYEVELNARGKAAERLEQLREIGGGDDVLLHLAELYRGLNDDPKLATTLEALLETPAAEQFEGAGSVRVLERLYELYSESLGVPEKAFHAARRLFALAPRDALEEELTRLADQLARPADLADAFERAALRANDAVTARRFRFKAAQAFVAAGQTKKARQALDALLEAQPRDAEALALLDQILARDASPDELITVLEARLASSSDDEERARTLMALADAYGKVRKTEPLIECLLEVLELAPKNADALARLDDALKGAERYAELADVLERRVRLAREAGDEEASTRHALRLAQLYDERLDRAADAAALYLALYEAGNERSEVLRALERLQAKGVMPVEIAAALQPYYARAEAWRKHVEMIQIRRDAEEDRERRSALSRAMAAVLEDRLRSPREAFEAWGAALLDEPESSEAVQELSRLAEVAEAHAPFAELVAQAAERLPDGPAKNALLAQRASLLQGVLNDQSAAIEAHKALLEKNPQHLPTLDALIELYEKRQAWDELREVLERRLEASEPADEGPVAAQLGVLQMERFQNAALARPPLERALAGEPPLKGALRTATLRNLVRALDTLSLESGAHDDVEALAGALRDLAECLAGKERADVRVRLGDVLRERLSRHDDALAAYEAALANDPENAGAEAGVRAIVDDTSAELGVRRSAARYVLARYEKQGNHAGRAHVMAVLLSFESEPGLRRQLTHSLAQLFLEELDEVDDALGLLLDHLEQDPEDATARQDAEKIGVAAGKVNVVLEAWAKLRGAEDEGLSRLYGERLAELAQRAGDLERAAEALEHLVARAEGDVSLWERLREVYDHKNDAEGVARCLAQLAALSEGSARVERLHALSDYCFEVLEDTERGLAALRDAVEAAPNSDAVLQRLATRLEQHQRFEELAEVLGARAEIASQAADKAALLLEQGRLLYAALERPADAVAVLTRSLEVERDGNSTARVEELLQQIARRADEAGLVALDAIIAHHRAQEAWQPLVESLEIAAEKRPGGEERAAMLDEVSRLYEEALRVPALAFREACRAFRDAPTTERAARVHVLADATGSFAELMAVLEDVAEAVAPEDSARAIELYREVLALAKERLDDREGIIRAAEAILGLDRGDRQALSVLEDIHRGEQDQERLIAVLERRAAASDDAAERHKTLLELGRLLEHRGDVEGAERAYRQVAHEDAGDDTSLAALDELYARTGNSAAQADILRRRIELREDAPSARAALRVRLAILLLQRRGDPAGASDELRKAVADAPALVEVRKGLEVLLEHARTHGAPPVHEVARLLEEALRAQEDWSALPHVVEMRLLGESEPATRAALMLEVAQIQEQRLAQPDFAFMWVVNAMKEVPEDESLRADAERLAAVTDNLDTLKELYDDVVDEVKDATLRAHLLRRIAELAESVGGDVDEARQRLFDAVAAGANDVATLQNLARLTRVGGDPYAHARVLQQLAEAAVLEVQADVAKEAYAELADVQENLGQLDAAIEASREMLVLDGADPVARATMERLLQRAARWEDLAAYLEDLVSRSSESERGDVLARLLRVQMEHLGDFAAAVETLERLEETEPNAASIGGLGAQLLQAMATEGSAEAIGWRGRVAVVLEPRYAAAEAWPHLVHILGLRLETLEDAAERQALWLRIVDLYEKTLGQPEQAFMAIGRALSEQPDDTALRERAERISVQLGDIETLIGLYEDISEQLPEDSPLHVTYALRAAELCELSVGDPLRATEYYEVALGHLLHDESALEERRGLLERVDRLYRAIGDPAKLAVTLSRRADHVPDDAPDAAEQKRQLLFEAATIQMHGMNDYGAAVTSLKKLLEAVPNDLPALRSLEEACKRQGRWSELAEALEQELAVLGAGDEARALTARFELGVVLDTHLGQSEDALAQFQAILEVAPDHGDTRSYLEQRLSARDTLRFDNAAFLQRSYERTGDWAKAIEVMRAQAQEHERRGERQEAAALLARVGQIQAQHMPGQEALAFGTFCEAMKLDPQNPDVRASLFTLAEENELLEELCEVYEEEAQDLEASGRSAVAAELRELMGRIYADALGDIAKAIEVFELILERHPGRAEATERLTEFYGKAGRWAELEQILRKRLMFLDDPKERAPLLLPLAQALADHLDRPEEAVPLLMELRRHDPSHFEARRLLVALHDAAGDLESLRPLLEEELTHCREAQDHDGLVFARGRLAVLLADQLGDVDSAIPLWEEIHAAEPENPAALSALERLYENTERWADLRALWEALLDRARDPALKSELTLKLGELLAEKLGGHDEAIERHLKVLELDPRNEASLNALRSLYRGIGRWDDLVSLLRRMMRFSTEPSQLKALRFDLADVLGRHLERRAEAVEMGRRILDIEPHSAEELERLASVFELCGAHEELAGVLERQATQLEGAEKVSALVRLAEVYEQHLGRAEAAAPAWEHILAVDPTQERAFERLRDIYTRSGEWQKLVTLKDERQRRIDDVDERIALLRDIGRVREEKLGQKEMAFLDACRAFRERWADRELAAWMDRLAIETESVEEALEIYDEALSELDDEERVIETHLRMAALAWEHLEDADTADTHYRRALEYDAKNAAALDGLVALYEAQERWQDAVAVLEQKAKLADDLQSRIEQLRETALLLEERAGDLEAAIATHKRILELEGRDQEALRSLARLYERQEAWQSLINVLERQEEVLEDTEERLAIRSRIATIWETHLDNTDQAIAVHRSILAEEGGYTTSLKALERLYTTLSRNDELIEVFEKMVELATDPEEQVRLLGKIAATSEESEGGAEKAVLANERILAIDPANIGAIKSLERLFRALREWNSLLETLEKHVTLSQEPKTIIELYLEIGEIHHKELGQSDKAEAAYNAALDFDPGSREALHALGQLYERSGNWSYALEKLQQEAQIAGASPEGTELHYRIGKINEDMLLDTAAAKAAYQQALDIDPRYLPAIRALKELAKSEKDNSAYLSWLKTEAQFTDDEDEQTELHTTAGLFLQETLSDPDGAAQEFEAALAVTFDHLPAARPLADICFSSENWERAEQLLDIITSQLDPEEDAAELCRMHYRLGYVCEKLEKEQKALKNYQRAYELDPTYLPGLEGLGAALSRAARFDDAAKIYQAILIHHRDDLTDAEVVDYYQQLAQLYFQLEDSERTKKNLQKALELDSSHAPSLRLLADAHRRDGDHEDCYEAMMRLAPLLPGDERVRVLIEIGELSQNELQDAYRAIDAYEDANRQRPQDGEILRALLELYRQTRQGGRAVEVLEELVRLEPDEKERVRLNHTLGEVYRDELKNEARAAQYFNAALDLDPTYIRSFQAVEELLSTHKNWKGLEENYIRMLQRIPADQGTIKRELWKNLAGVYRYRLKDANGAAQAYTVLHKMEPDNVETLEALADLLARVPQKIDEAIVAYQRLVPLLGDRPQRALHALVRLYHNRRLPDRAFLATAALRVIGDLMPDEAKLYQHYLKLQPPEPRAALTTKLWDALLVHPQATGPVAELSDILWRAAAPLLATPLRDFGLDKKKLWRREDLDAPVPTFFVTQLKKVRSVLGLGQFELFVKHAAAEPLMLLPVERPIFAVGEANEVFREMPDRQLRFLCARQVAYLRRSFVLPRVLGAQRFQAVIEAAVRLVEPRYPARSDPRVVAEYEKLLQRVGPPLVSALKPHVAALLKTKQPLNVKSFLEGMEHTTIRAAYAATGSLELAAQLLRQPDPGPMPLPYGAKLKELLLFAVSDANFELRQRIGTATPS